MVPVRFLLVFLLFLLSTVAFLDRTNISIAGVALAQEYALTQIQLGWVFSAFLLGYAGFQIPAGWLAVRLGPRNILSLGVLWWGVFTALTALVPPTASHGLTMLFLVRLGLGIGESVVYPAANQIVARWVPVQERGKANGWIFAGVGAGAGLTPPILNAIIESYGWRASFWFCAVVGCIVGLIWYIVARDRPDQHPRVSDAELEHIRAGIDTSRPAARTPVPWRRIFSNRDVLALTISYFTFGYVVWIFFSWFFIYLAEVRGLNLKTSALYSMLPFIAMTVCCLLGGVINDAIVKRYGLRLGRCGLPVIALLLTAVFLVFGSIANSATVATLVLAGGAGAIYLSQSAYWSVTADFAGEHAGVVSGVMNMGCQVGGAITASLTPWIAAELGWKSAFFVAAALAVIGAVAWLLVDPTRTLEDGRLPRSAA
ncbi:MFS transporter [Steroidobacter sp. S1-65]|uniref:MFS transporter n=1 Tax=Steroidobacter gossypii TaxID=2805490 RepID=A0ABS1X084_9GAMM|nr:MFS transporter [Steroidobacter gossypii]MBM0106650.1 MFS transporter [Steroidobacter gossypii]